MEYYAKKLDVDTEKRNEDFVCKNWQGLAEYMGIEPSVSQCHVECYQRVIVFSVCCELLVFFLVFDIKRVH